uniref:Cerebellin 18 n=1 Tax=Sphaeramia orbicularis TaxID=375764 RepID=A0A673CGN7_9TELE
MRSMSALASISAEVFKGVLPCGKWDCECAFRHQKGCCCAGLDLHELEVKMFRKMMTLVSTVSQLGDSIYDVIGSKRVAFTVFLGANVKCIGPFPRNTTIPYDVIILNDGDGYKPALGVFTASCSGLYSFTFTVYSKVAKPSERMFYKVQLVKNGVVVASTVENNKQDSEDSATQVVLLVLQRGDQVYVELKTGRQLCGNIQGLNIFSGHLVYPIPT